MPERDSDELLQWQFDRALGAVATTIAVLSTAGPGGRGAMTIDAALPVANRDPSLIVCLPTEHPVSAAVAANGRFTVNYLAVGNENIADQLSAQDATAIDEEFPGSVASVECAVSATQTIPGHVVVIGRVLVASTNDGTEPLLRVRGEYRRIEELPNPVFPHFRRSTAPTNRIEMSR